MLLSLAFAAVLSQTAATPAEASADKAAASAQKAAEAAEKAAEAMQRIADVLAPRPPPGAAPGAPVPPTWTGTVGLSLAFTYGNSLNLAASGNVAIDRKWTDWALGIRLAGAYGLANPSSDPNVAAATTALRAGGTVRGDRNLGSDFATAFLLVGSEFDHLKNLESRTIGEVGASMKFFDVKAADYEKLILKLDLGIRAGYETNYDYFPADPPPALRGLPPAVILAPRVAVAFRWGFSKEVRLSEDLEVIPFLLAPNTGRLLLNSATKLSARLTDTVALTTGLLVTFDSKPPGTGRSPTDVSLNVGLDVLL
jgi:hypothetical protein